MTLKQWWWNWPLWAHWLAAIALGLLIAAALFVGTVILALILKIAI